MTWNADEVRLQVARDLREIERLYASLRVEAINRSGHPDMPGGPAMVMLGPGANVEAFGYMQLSAIFGRIEDEAVEEVLKSDIEPPLSFLASWVDLMREERGQDQTRRTASIAGEVRYLSAALDWMTSTNDEGVPWYLQVEDFAAGLSRVRSALENVLHDGDRAEWARVTCINDDCGEKPRLMKVYEDDAADDHHKCPACGGMYDYDEYVRAANVHAASEAAEDAWVTVADAAHSLSRPANTVRTWIKTDRVSTQKAPGKSTLTYVYWPDVREADKTARVMEIKRRATA